MTTASPISDYYAHNDRLSTLEVTRSFVESILDQARKSGNELQIEEFEAKLKAIDEEINHILK